jgi:nucleoid DNA-binding protein
MDTKFLIELIEKNTRVILPDFGAFLVKDDGTGVFKSHNITFSPFLRFNDGVLEDALMKGKKISKDEAIKQIAQFIDEIKNDLSSKGNFNLGNFGSLYRDKRGSIHFSTDERIIDSKKEAEVSSAIAEVTDETSSTSSLLNISEEVPEAQPKIEKPVEPVSAPVEDIKETKPNKVEPEKKEFSKQSKVGDEKKEPPKPSKVVAPKKVTPIAKPKPQPEFVQEKPKEKKETGAGKAILMGVLIGVIFIALASGGWYLYTENYFTSNSDEVENLDIIEPNVSGESKEVVTHEVPKSSLESEFEKPAVAAKPEVSKKESDKPKQPVTTTQPEKEEAAKPTTTPVAKRSEASSGQFHIVVGSFRNLEYAEKYSNDMKRSGFASQVIKRENGMYSVTLGTYNTRDEATQAMSQFRNQHPSAWILKQ